MNADTQREVNGIKAQGYYRKGLTLLEGGWGEVYSFASGWKTYILIDGDGEEVETITARDDETAVKALGELFYLDEIPFYQIVEKIVEFRTVKEG